MGTVTVPVEFFRGELRVYDDWRTAFARELLQNATDARPRSIEITTETVNGHGRVTFRDTGHGMSRAVLEDVFFALGKTTKTGTDSIGGFGRARIIICFAQHAYTIRSGNLLVTGHGGDYTLTEVPERMAGTEFVIDLIDEDHYQIRAAFESLLATSSLEVPVTLNGYPARGQRMPSRAARVLRDEQDRAWGKVYLVEDPTSYVGSLRARVHGLVMFERPLYQMPGHQQVILELIPSRSREVLAASRDQLHTSYGDQLDEFVAQLSSNRRAALRAPVEPLRQRLTGGGFTTTAPRASAPEPDVDLDLEGAWVRPAPASAPGSERGVADTEGAPPAAGQDPQSHPGASAAAAMRSLTGLVGDVYMLADRHDARVRKLIRSWCPTRWGRDGGGRRAALLRAWHGACAHALDLLVELHPELGEISWTVGWTFDEDVRGVHLSDGGGHVLALNPVDEFNRSRYHLSRPAERRQLLAVALHEVAHVVHPYHDESFAGLLTELVGACDPRAADKAIRERA